MSKDEVLIKKKTYLGKYVAIKTLNNPDVIASGENVREVYRKAAKKDKDPLIVFVPKEKMVQIMA